MSHRQDTEIRRALADAKKRDDADPVVLYVEQHRDEPRYYCRICGVRKESVPVRASDVHSLPTNPSCSICKQPVLRP